MTHLQNSVKNYIFPPPTPYYHFMSRCNTGRLSLLFYDVKAIYYQAFLYVLYVGGVGGGKFF